MIAILLGGSAVDNNSRKRKNDWNQQHQTGGDDFSDNSPGEPQVKVSNRDRKSQGENNFCFTDQFNCSISN